MRATSSQRPGHWRGRALLHWAVTTTGGDHACQAPGAAPPAWPLLLSPARLTRRAGRRGPSPRRPAPRTSLSGLYSGEALRAKWHPRVQLLAETPGHSPKRPRQRASPSGLDSGRPPACGVASRRAGLAPSSERRQPGAWARLGRGPWPSPHGGARVLPDAGHVARESPTPPPVWRGPLASRRCPLPFEAFIFEGIQFINFFFLLLLVFWAPLLESAVKLNVTKENPLSSSGFNSFSSYL